MPRFGSARRGQTIQSTEQEHFQKIQRRQNEPGHPDTAQQAQQDGLSQLLQRVSGSDPRGLGDTPPAGDDTTTAVLQRKQARILGDSRLSQPMYAQRRADLFLQLQQTYGNTYTRQVARLIGEQHQPALLEQHATSTVVQREADKEDKVDEEEIHRQAAPSAVAVQRQGGTTTHPHPATHSASTATQERELAEKILGDIQRRGGITVAAYAAHNVKSAAEFERQANQFAQDHGAIGLAGSTVKIGAAMALEVGLSTLLQRLTNDINTLLAKFPDLNQNQSLMIPIQTLAIFTHGEKNQIEAGAGGQWIKNSLHDWVVGMVPYLSKSPQVFLYACNTAGTPPKGLPFAQAMQQILQTELENRYGTEAGVAPEVFGHTTAAHTTANAQLVGFSGSGSMAFIPELGSRMATLAIERVGGAELTEAQHTALAAKGQRAITRVFRTTDREQGTTSPKNVFIREMPQMGVDRVWTDLTTEATPDYSYLGLTPKATARVAQGLLQFQALFATELAKLVHQVGAH